MRTGKGRRDNYSSLHGRPWLWPYDGRGRGSGCGRGRGRAKVLAKKVALAVAVCEAAVVVVFMAVEVAVAVTLIGVVQGRVCEGIELTGRQRGPLDGTATDRSGLKPLTATDI